MISSDLGFVSYIVCFPTIICADYIDAGCNTWSLHRSEMVSTQRYHCNKGYVKSSTTVQIVYVQDFCSFQ